MKLLADILSFVLAVIGLMLICICVAIVMIADGLKKTFWMALIVFLISCSSPKESVYFNAAQDTIRVGEFWIIDNF